MKRSLPRIALWFVVWLPWLYVGVFADTRYQIFLPHGFHSGPSSEHREYGWPYPYLELDWNLPRPVNDPSTDVEFFYPSLLTVNLLVSVAITTVFAFAIGKWIGAIRRNGFRFRTSTLLLLVVAVSLPLAGWRYVEDEYRHEEAIVSQLEQEWVYVHWTDEPLLFSRLKWILPERVGEIWRRVGSAQISWPTSLCDPTNTMDLLAQLKHLESLDFDGISEPDDLLPLLWKLPNLKRVYFYGAPVTDFGIEHLQKCPWLKEIEFEVTEVSDDEIQRLRSALPNTEIIYDGWKPNE